MKLICVGLLLPSWVCEAYLCGPFITFMGIGNLYVLTFHNFLHMWNLSVSAIYYLHGYVKLICVGLLLPSCICQTYLCQSFITFMDMWNLPVLGFYYLHGYMKLICVSLWLPSWTCETYLCRPFITFMYISNLFAPVFYYLHGYVKLICVGLLLPSWICEASLCQPFITFMDMWNLSVSALHHHPFSNDLCEKSFARIKLSVCLRTKTKMTFSKLVLFIWYN